jgi:hypothetical protein
MNVNSEFLRRQKEMAMGDFMVLFQESEIMKNMSG